jgi:hypothetical protein
VEIDIFMDVQSEEVGVSHGRRRVGVTESVDVPRASTIGSGWGEEGASSAGGIRGGSSGDPQVDDTVQVVRDGDEAAETSERLAATVAEAPRNAARRVATVRELEGEGGGAGSLNVAASRAEGIDISMLTSGLYPVEALAETDEVVNWELELQLITQELAQENDGHEDASEGSDKQGGGAAATSPNAAATRRK